MTQTGEWTELERPPRNCGSRPGEPLPRVAAKDRPSLHEYDEQWLAASPVPPGGDVPGLDGTCDVPRRRATRPASRWRWTRSMIAIPERPGNRRADGYRNILANPHVGLSLHAARPG